MYLKKLCRLCLRLGERIGRLADSAVGNYGTGKMVKAGPGQIGADITVET
jgi:hypothetical protein